MINLDDPVHQVQRRLVVRRFTPRAVRDHEAEVRVLADRIIDEATADGTGSVEVVEQIASRLPAMEIAHLLGYAPQQWPLIRQVSEITMFRAGQTPADGRPFGLDRRASEVMGPWAAETMRLSARGYHRVLRVARTLADLDHADTVGRLHLAEALSYRTLAEEARTAA